MGVQFSSVLSLCSLVNVDAVWPFMSGYLKSNYRSNWLKITRSLESQQSQLRSFLKHILTGFDIENITLYA